MKGLLKVRHVLPMEDHWIRVTFSNGAVKEIGLGDVIAKGPAFQLLREDRGAFERVRVNERGVIEWPGEVNLDSEVLYGSFEPASGVRISRRTVKAPTASVA